MNPAPTERIDYAKILDGRTKALILFGVLLGLFLSALDQTIVSTAMPRITEDLHGLDLYTWVTTAYLLTNTALVPIYGKLSDLYGRKPVLMFGIVVFLIGSALCGLSGEPFLGQLFGGGMMQLVVFRGLQGIGAAALGSVAFAIIADLFEPADRPRFQGLFGAVFGLSSVIGPLLGGFLTDHVSWRWVFYVNLPLGFLALAFIAAKMPRLASGLKARVDWLGALFIVLFSVPLLLALTWGANGQWAWSSPQIIGLFALSALSLLLFLVAESRHPSPILPLKLFTNPTFTWGAVARFVIGAGFFGALLFLSLYLVQVQGVSATKAGTATVPLTFGLIAGAILSGQIASHIGRYKLLMLIGLVTAALGFYGLSTLTADTPYSGVIWRMILLGLGLGPSLPLYTTALQLSVQPAEIGVATSSGQFFQQLGGTVGTAIFGVILTTGLIHNLPTAFEAQAAAQSGTVATTLTTIAQQVKDKSGSAGSEGFSQEAPPSVQQVHERFTALKTQVQALITKGDESARRALQQSTALPAETKESLNKIPAGGVAAGVQGQMQQLQQAIARAVNSGQLAQVQALAQRPEVPAPVQTALKQLNAAALTNEAARAAFLKQLQDRLDQGSRQQAEAAQQKTLDQALSSLNDGEQVALASSRATKVAFAQTIAQIYRYCIGAALLAFLATLMMPNLSMPRRQKLAPAHVEV